MKTATPNTEPPAATPFQKAGFGGSRICFAALCCAVAFEVSAQPTAPLAVPLGAYAQSLPSPARVAVAPSGCVYVTDPQAGQVAEFDAFGRPGTTHAGLARPLGIAVDAQGKIYLAEEQTGSVSVFDAQWVFLYKLGQGNGEFQLPNHIALDPAFSGGTVYVSDSKANLVKVYVGATLAYVFGSAGTGNGQFNFPAGICISTNGEVFVVDQGNDRIQVFGLAGNFLRAFRLGSSTPSGRSQAALLDSAGRLYVVDSFQGLVKAFAAASGASLSQVGGFGQLPGKLDSPAGLALDSLNRLFVTSANTHRLELFGLDAFVHLSIEPAAGTIAAGTNLILRALTGGTGTFACQWLKDGHLIGGATNDTLTINGVAPSDAGGYSVIVAGYSLTFTSSVTQVAVMLPPKILADPQSLSVLRGSNAVLTVIASGSVLNYQWRFNGFNLDGATAPSLTLTEVQTFQAGLYSVAVSNAVGVVTSTAARLDVIALPTILEIVSSAMDTNQWFHLTLNADAGIGYALEASTNLFQWLAVTNFVQDAGLIEFADPDSAEFRNRFYRLRWLP